MYSNVCPFAELSLRNVCRAFLGSKEWKWLIFIASVTWGCIFIIVWKRSSKSSNFSDFPSNVTVVELTGRTVRVCVDGLLLIPTSMSASLLMGSVVTFDNEIPGTCWREFWDSLCVSSGCCRVSWDCMGRPVRNPGTVWGVWFAPVIMSQSWSEAWESIEISLFKPLWLLNFEFNLLLSCWSFGP